MTFMKENQITYQFILVVSPKLDEKDREKALSKVEGWLGVNGAEIAKKDHVGSKELVYAIADQRKGDFWIMDVTSKLPLKLNELNLMLNRESAIIRYLILKK